MSARVPPHDLDAEAAVLSALLLDDQDGTAWDAASALLVDGSRFYSPTNRMIYEAVADLRAERQPVDAVTVGGWLRRRERLAEVGGVPALIRITDAAPDNRNVASYAATVVRTHKRRTAIRLAQEMAAAGYGDVGDDVEGWVGGFAEQLRVLADDSAAIDSCAQLGPTLRTELQRMEQRARTGQAEARLPTGITALDELLRLAPGDVCVIAGRPGMGKSALGFGVLTTVADQTLWSKEDAEAWPADEVPAALGFSLEMPKEQIALRALCGRARVPIGQLRRGRLAQADWDRLSGAAPELLHVPVWLDDRPAITIDYVRAKIRKVAAEAARTVYEDGARGRLRLVVIDYLQLMTTREARGITMAQAIGEITKALKEIAKAFGVVVVLLSQLNRGLESRPDKRPILSDLRESGAIEQDADQIVFCYRDEYYRPDSRFRGIGELLIAKQRNGETGRVLTRWHGQFTLYEDLSPSEREQLEREAHEARQQTQAQPRQRRGLL